MEKDIFTILAEQDLQILQKDHDLVEQLAWCYRTMHKLDQSILDQSIINIGTSQN